MTRAARPNTLVLQIPDPSCVDAISGTCSGPYQQRIETRQLNLIGGGYAAVFAYLSQYPVFDVDTVEPVCSLLDCEMCDVQVDAVCLCSRGPSIPGTTPGLLCPSDMLVP